MSQSLAALRPFAAAAAAFPRGPSSRALPAIRYPLATPHRPGDPALRQSSRTSWLVANPCRRSSGSVCSGTLPDRVSQAGISAPFRRPDTRNRIPGPPGARALIVFFIARRNDTRRSSCDATLPPQAARSPDHLVNVDWGSRPVSRSSSNRSLSTQRRAAITSPARRMNVHFAFRPAARCRCAPRPVLYKRS